MRSMRFALAGLALLFGLAAWPGAWIGRAQDPNKPQWLQHFYGSQPAAAPQAPVVRGSQPEVEINEDILVKPEVGPWMISIISYSGPEAPRMAREMVTELRGPNYNLPAYVFNHGADKRRQEQARVDELIKIKKQRYEKLGAQGPVTIRVGKIRIDEECAVLVGGYNDMDTARRALDTIRQMKPPDPNRVKLQMAFRTRPSQTSADKVEGEVSPSNPFKHSFVVHNPSVPNETAPDRNKLDMSKLRNLNRGENYSLLSCPKAFTLAVSGYSVPSILVNQNTPSSLWDRFGLGKSGREDAAAHSAHNLAELIHKMRLTAYVLHTEYSSIVTVGAFNSVNDPELLRLQTEFSRLSADPRYSLLKLFPDPKPMQVPRQPVFSEGPLVMNQHLPVIYLVRHGETAWSVSGQHTGRTDIPLTERGERNALKLGERLKGLTFDRVFTSPLQRARRTCELAGFGGVAVVDPDLVEWDYGQCEGKRTAEIRKEWPDWQLFRDGCPGGESVAEIGARADRVLARLRTCDGDVLLFSSGHFLRVLAARWLGLEPSGGRLFLLGTASLSVFGYEHDKNEPVLRLWNDARQVSD